MRRREGGERHHLPVCATHIPVIDITRQHTILRLRHDVHFLHTTAVDEVVDVAAAPRRSQRGIDVANGNAQRLRFFLVDVDFKLRRIFQTVRTHLRKQIRVFGRFAQQLVTSLRQLVMAKVALVDKLKVKAGRRTEFHNRRKVKGEHHRIFNLRETAHRTARNGRDFVFRARTLIPVFQRDERQTGVLAAAGEAKAVNGKDRVNVVFLLGEVIVGHLIQYLLGTLLGGARWQLRHRQEDALVLFRQERAWQTDKQERHRHDDQQIEQQITTGAAQNVAYAVGVMVRALVEHAVKPAEEAFFAFAVIAFRDRFKHGGAQRRRQDQRHDNRQHHRGNDSNGELTVNRTGRAAKERHRDKYRREHQRDTDQRALNLTHRFTGRFFGRQAFFNHHTLDVLNHDDGVIHQQTDGEHHPEHGEGVYRVAEGRQYRKRTEQDDRHRDGRDKRRAEVLKEEIHHQEHQHDRFDQRFHHFENRDFNERRGVIRVNHFQTAREERLKTSNGLTHRFSGIQRVRAGREFDTETRRRLAVIARDNVVVFTAQLHLRHVFQQHARTILIHFQQDFAELFSRGQTGLRDDRGVQLLAFHRRRTAKLTGRYLGVLRFQRAYHIDRRQLEVVQLVRVEPDTHRVLGTEELHVAHARGTADRIFNVRARVVRDIFLLHRAVGVDKAQHHQERAGGFLDAHALLLNFLRQQRHGELQFVLHLYLRDVRVGAGFERQRDLHRPRGVAGGGHVHQAIDTVHVLFDNLRHGILHRFRIRARVGCVNRHRWRRNRRILRNGQFHNGQATCQHDDDGDHPREDGAIDKKLSHVLTAPVNSRLRLL